MSHPRRSASLLLVSLVLSLAACGAASGQVVRVGTEVEPGVVYLGHRLVSFRVERDVIDIGRYEGRFSSLRVRVKDAPLEMFDIRVQFANGEVWSPETRLFFGQGEWSRRIDLPGDNRAIRRIEFVYKSAAPRAGKAHVQVFGVR